MRDELPKASPLLEQTRANVACGPDSNDYEPLDFNFLKPTLQKASMSDLPL